jgi:hypothetical protein
MPSQNTAAVSAAHDLECSFRATNFGHAGVIADLVLERLPSGEYCYLRPIDGEPRYVLTDRGRDDLRRAEAEAWLFGAR